MRYQQGIGTPQTLGVQPTLWKEPKTFVPKAFNLPNIDSGASRDYGDPGPSVDTQPSRWGSPKNTNLSAEEIRDGVSGWKEIGKNWSSRTTGASPSITSPSTSRTMGRSSRGEVDSDERRGSW